MRSSPTRSPWTGTRTAAPPDDEWMSSLAGNAPASLGRWGIPTTPELPSPGYRDSKGSCCSSAPTGLYWEIARSGGLTALDGATADRFVYAADPARPLLRRTRTELAVTGTAQLRWPAQQAALHPRRTMRNSMAFPKPSSAGLRRALRLSAPPTPATISGTATFPSSHDNIAP
jgi:hypothetical protein